MFKKLLTSLAGPLKPSFSKLGVLLVILLVGGVAIGCASHTSQPKGWSGGVVADGTLFLGSMEGRVLALNESGGAQLWSATLEPPKRGSSFGCTAAPSGVAIYGTPVASGGLVYVSAYDGKVYALNSDSGAERWVYPREGNLQPIVGGPVVASGKVYFGCTDGKLYALDANTGVKEWEFKTEEKIWATPAAEPPTARMTPMSRTFCMTIM